MMGIGGLVGKADFPARLIARAHARLLGVHIDSGDFEVLLAADRAKCLGLSRWGLV